MLGDIYRSLVFGVVWVWFCFGAGLALIVFVIWLFLFVCCFLWLAWGVVWMLRRLLFGFLLIWLVSDFIVGA